MDTKKCKYCNETFPITHFKIANVINGKKYRRHKCKKCKQKDQTNRIRKITDKIHNFKKDSECSMCGNNDPRVLVFHHTDKNKEFNIADGPRLGFSFEKIKREIEKCDILCSNCHKILHYEERLNNRV